MLLGYLFSQSLGQHCPIEHSVMVELFCVFSTVATHHI